MRALILGLILSASSAPARGAETRLTIVIEANDAMKASVLKNIGGGPVTVREFDRSLVSDPIAKGRLLAALQAGGMLVTVGDAATDFVLTELDDPSVFFAGGRLIAGHRLASPSVAGILGYNIDGMMDAVAKLWSGKVGLAFTPGYEGVAAWVRAAAKARGLSVIDKKVSSRREIPAAVSELVDQSRVIWIVGDPMLARGAGFQYLAERALSRDIPIVAASPWELRNGAFLSIETPSKALADQANAAIQALARGEKPSGPDLQQAPAGGMILLNGALVERWKVQPPANLQWRTP